MDCKTEPGSNHPTIHHQLAAFLGTRRDHLLGAWKEALLQNRQKGQVPDVGEAGLIDHLPHLFDDLIAILRGEPAATEQATRDASTHGQTRWDQHYSLTEVLAELGIVSRLLLKDGFDAFAKAHADLDRDALRPARENVLGFFEEAAAGSVRQYVLRQEKKTDVAQEELHREERRVAAMVQGNYDLLAGMFQSAPSFLALLRGSDHVFHLANDQYRRITGHRELLGKMVREALPEVVEQGYVQLLDRVYTTGESYVGKDVCILLQSEPGAPPREHFVDFVYLPTRAEDGTVDGIVVHGVDWTERKRAQHAAGELSEQRRLALDSARMGWWHLDVGSGRMDMDDRFRAIFDVAQKSDAYTQVLGRIHPEDRARVDAAVQAAIRPVDPAPYEVEYRVVRRDGSLRWVAAKGQPSYEGKGSERRTVGFSGTMTDITEEKNAHDALRSKEVASRFLADLGEATRRTTDPDAVLGVVVDALRAHLAADRCAYAEVEEDQDAITIRYDCADPDGSGRSLAGRHQLSSFGARMLPTLRAGETVVIRDVATDLLVADAKEAMAAVGVAAVVNVPLVKTGRLVAVLAVHENHPRDWTADEVALIEAVAERSWGEVERSRAARALTFERHQLELIFRESPAAMTTWRGEDFVFTRVNPEYQDIFRGRQLLGRPLLEACPELVGQGFDDLLREVLRTGKPFVGREVLAKIQRDKDGPVEDRYFDFSYLQITDPAGNPWGVYDHAVDVTDRVRARLEVEQTQRELRQLLAEREQLLAAEQAARAEAERVSQMKDEFLATLSHELRTPLNAILGWTQVLRDDPSLSEDTTAGLATIERNARAQTQIIEDLLDMSKIISGKVRLDVQPLQLDQVVSAAVDTMRPAAAAKHIRLQALIDPQARMINGDPNRLQQVFWNLLSNALKFTPKDGKVQVVLERVNSHLEVSIADTGEGIAPEFLPYVFDRFRQQDASTTRKHGGLGLGLAIVKQLVELHGGSIRAESAGAGQGTTFCVTLPLSVVQPAREDVGSERRHPQSPETVLSAPVEMFDLTGVKVLVVDDELDARTLVKRLLEDRRADVHTAGSVAEALSLFQAERPDVLVSDIGMPGEDGYALIRQVRALSSEEGGNTPAVALTAYARSEDRLKAILAGFEMHLSKPVNTVELLALVAKLAGRTKPSFLPQ